MLKMYMRSQWSGASDAFWDHNWETSDQYPPDDRNDRSCENQGCLQRAIAQRIVHDRLFLEGGCGPAAWVRYYDKRGYRVMGLDFAPRTVQRVKTLFPKLDVRIGDVMALPLQDGEVHTYFSNGVVEHFEPGPAASLREARRVIAKDGWFLCSVPDASPLRNNLLYRDIESKASGALGVTLVRRVGETVSDSSPPPGMTFFQYAFTEAEFTAQLEDAGFCVEGAQGYSLQWGLMEIPVFDKINTLATKALGAVRTFRRKPDAAALPAVLASSVAGPRNPLLRLVERIAFQEDTTVPGVGPVLAWLLDNAANMRLFIARPR